MRLPAVTSMIRPLRSRAIGRLGSWSSVGLLVAALALLLGMLGYFLYASYRQVIQSTTITTRNLVQVIESSLSDDFARMDGVLSFVAREAAEADLGAEPSSAGHLALTQRLAALKASFPKIAALNLFDAEGELRRSSNPAAENVSIAGLAHFELLRDSPDVNVVFSIVRVAGTTGRRSFAQGRALRNDKGEFLGVAGAVFDLDEIAKLFRRIDVGQGGLVLLRRSDDSTLIQRFPPLNEADFNQPLPRTNAIRQRIDAGERSGTLTYTASTDGIERIGSFKVLDDFPFYVQVALAETEYLAGWWRQVYRIGGVALILLLGFGFAIARLYRDERQLERIAHFDALTDLPNRVLLADRLEQAMYRARRSGRKLALVYLDLDGFKAINDAHGHAAGDRLLVKVAQHMRDCLREGDTVARLGGDEFVAVLADVDSPSVCMWLVQRLVAAIDQPVRIDGLDLRVSSSIGVTFYPQEETVGADQLLRQADQAMYEAKLAGRNRYHLFDIAQHQQLRGQHEQIQRIRDALDRREFVLHFQPKVNMSTGTVIGVEALIRWEHPEQGLLPPAAFLPLIEQHSLDIDVGIWVLDTALEQLETWQAAGLVLSVSVNVSAHFLQHPDFVPQLTALLARHSGLSAARLELEVLETSALSDFARASSVIESCSRLGVRIAMDDFGTGYSSLSYLKRLPVSVLKIDQSFVRDMLHDPDDLSILEGVLGLARAFQREVIAEGVETLEHGQLLLQLGCELAQGYGIARPMPARQLPAWIANWRPDPSWSRTRALQGADMSLLHACVEHRAWTNQLEAFLADACDTPAAVDPQHCPCGKWLDQWQEREGGNAQIDGITATHRRLHEVARQLMSLKRADSVAQAPTALGEMRLLSGQLLGQLQALIDCRSNRPGLAS